MPAGSTSDLAPLFRAASLLVVRRFRMPPGGPLVPMTLPGPDTFPGPLLTPLEYLMALIATLNPGLLGAAPAPVAANGGGDTVAPGTRVHVLNGGGSSINVTVVTPGTARSGLAIADQVIACPNGSGIAGCKTFDVPGDLYADPTTGLVNLTYSAVTSVTVWAEGPVAS